MGSLSELANGPAGWRPRSRGDLGDGVRVLDGPRRRNAMPKYRVKEKNSVTKDTKEYRAGQLVELSEDEAAAMPWAVELEAQQEKKGK
jgi:hypothetical protein